MVVGISMVRDEADIIGFTVARMLTQVDHVLIADNNSIDGTREILEDLRRGGAPLTIRDDPEPGYFQAHKMSLLAVEAAHELNASWVVAFDADEVWYSPFGRIADVLTQHPRASIATAELYDHVATALDPEDEQDPVQRIAWRRRDAAPLRKVACRPYARVRIHQGNHDASYGDRVDGQLVVRHFPYRSPAQLVRKVRNGAAAYRATDLPEHQGAHWREWGRLLDERGEDAIEEIFRTWYWREDPGAPLDVGGELQPPLTCDPAPA